MPLSALKRTALRAIRDPVDRYAETHGAGSAHRIAAAHGDHTPRVAVLDTSVTPAFDRFPVNAEVVASERFSEGQGASHGTQTASVVAGAGIDDAPAVEILSATVTAAGVNPDAERGALPAAIRWAADNDADVMVMALAGHPESREAERAAIEYAVEHGTLPLASTGNGDRGRACFPARHPDVLAVGGTDTVGGRVSLPLTDAGSNWPADVCAWGLQVPAYGVPFPGEEPSLTFFSGTSAAVATVGHAAALVRRVAPDRPPAAVRGTLTATGTPVDADRIGPRVNAADAVRTARKDAETATPNAI